MDSWEPSTHAATRGYETLGAEAEDEQEPGIGNREKQGKSNKKETKRVLSKGRKEAHQGITPPEHAPAERGERDLGGPDLPPAVVGHALAAQCARDDLVAEADAWE
ncbi:hypothetical protein CVT26_013779 [Gymnopilus dilepis]|uniref:Uncharacterized protein n=1 Tax=Gymnopilus dilepis TaxID=231916 RepID=A0A409Y6C7_9AGAR|nr:hypothetical protein CVT26_013779 [Gymnopilus dilepis]